MTVVDMEESAPKTKAEGGGGAAEAGQAAAADTPNAAAAAAQSARKLAEMTTTWEQYANIKPVSVLVQTWAVFAMRVAMERKQKKTNICRLVCGVCSVVAIALWALGMLAAGVGSPFEVRATRGPAQRGQKCVVQRCGASHLTLVRPSKCGRT